MAQEVTNFARFYALFNKLPYQRRPGRVQEVHRVAVYMEPDRQSS